MAWNGQPIVSLREEYAADCLRGACQTLKDELSALENLEIAHAGGPPRTPTWLGRAGGIGRRSMRASSSRALSQGQRRRVSLARLALRSMGAGNENGARLWILDEPFSALDTAAVAHLEHLIVGHVKGGGMAVLTTHQPLGITTIGMFRIELEFEMETVR